MGDVLMWASARQQGDTWLQFEAGIFRGQQLLNTVELVYVFANADQQPSPCPATTRHAQRI